MRIALVHDYLAQDGGAERVLKAFYEVWPNAPIFVLFHDKKRITSFPKADIKQSFIARLPFGKRKYQIPYQSYIQVKKQVKVLLFLVFVVDVN